MQDRTRAIPRAYCVRYVVVCSAGPARPAHNPVPATLFFVAFTALSLAVVKACRSSSGSDRPVPDDEGIVRWLLGAGVHDVC